MCVQTGSHAGGEVILWNMPFIPRTLKKKVKNKIEKWNKRNRRQEDFLPSESWTRCRNLRVLSNYMKSSVTWNILKRLSSLQDQSAIKSAKVNREKWDNVECLGQNSGLPCLFTAFYQSVLEKTVRIETTWEHHDQQLDSNTVCLDTDRERERSGCCRWNIVVFTSCSQRCTTGDITWPFWSNLKGKNA